MSYVIALFIVVFAVAALITFSDKEVKEKGMILVSMIMGSAVLGYQYFDWGYWLIGSVLFGALLGSFFQWHHRNAKARFMKQALAEINGINIK